MTDVSPALQRAFALGLLGIVALVVVNFIVTPTVQHAHDYDIARMGLEAKLRGKQQLIARMPELEAKLNTLRLEQSASRTMFQDHTVAVAGASLQNQIRAHVTQSGSEIVSVEALPATPIASLNRFGVKMVFRCDDAALQSILVALEQNEPRLEVERLAVAANAMGRKGARKAHMTTTLEVYGYWKAPG